MFEPLAGRSPPRDNPVKFDRGAGSPESPPVHPHSSIGAVVVPLLIQQVAVSKRLILAKLIKGVALQMILTIPQS
jgi:hypothetical protein